MNGVMQWLVRDIQNSSKGCLRSRQKTVVLRSGERIDCLRVNDHGDKWGLSPINGPIRIVKKDEVKEIVPMVQKDEEER